MAFEKSKHLIRVQGGREYLPVSARLIWFREEHPDWGITTTPLEINLEKQYAIYQASIFNAEGKLMATATKMENVKGFPDFLEKAETGAVGRALAFCGYGTQFAPELEENNRLADAPYPMGGGNRFAGGNGGSRMAAPAPRPGGLANGGNRPLPPRAPEPQRHAGDGRPVEDAEPGFGDTDAPVADAAPVPARASAVAERPAPPPQPMADEEDDPFAEPDEPPVRAPVAPPVRAAAARNATNEAGEPVLSNNRCSEEGCTVTLTPGQVSMSQGKFGRALCPRHQRDATPVTGGANAGPRRAAGAKPEMADTLL